MKSFLYDLSDIFLYLLKISRLEYVFYYYKYDFFILEKDWMPIYEEFLISKHTEIKEENLDYYCDCLKEELYNKGFGIDEKVLSKLLKIDCYVLNSSKQK